MKTPIIALLTTVFFLIIAEEVRGQNDSESNPAVTKKGVEPPKPKKTSVLDWMMEEEETLTLNLASNFELLKDQRRQQEYQEATITLLEDEGQSIRQQVQIKPRGKFRCVRCDMPPVKIKFYKDTLRSAGLSKMNELKLVIPCKEGKDYHDYLLKEYLAYRLYNVLTERSLRVKRVDVQFNCTETDESYRPLPAFIIEHEEEIVKRLDAEPVDSMGFSPDSYSRDDYLRVQLFQFMIGNTDWIPPTKHNFDLIEIDEEDGLVPVPFDFDFSGLVGTDYAAPNSLTGIANVQERFFMGNGWTEGELEAAFRLYREKKDELLAVIDNFDELSKRERRLVRKFIEGFYDIIDDPKEVRRYITERPTFHPAVY